MYLYILYVAVFKYTAVLIEAFIYTCLLECVSVLCYCLHSIISCVLKETPGETGTVPRGN